MSKSLGQFWGFESSLTGRGDRFGLLQVNVSMRIPTTSLPGISPTTPIAPSQSSSVVTITLRHDGFTVSLPHAPQHQGPIQTGVFGPRPTVANDNAQSTPTTIEVPLAAAAAMGNIPIGHDLFAALGQMLRATPANTNTQGPQTQPSPATPQTHTPQAHSHQPTPSHIPANTNAHASQQQTVHTQPTSAQQPTPSTAQAPTVTHTNPEVRTTLSSGLNINGPRTEGSHSLEERFLKLPQAEQRKILETLRPALERNLSAKYKNNADIPKVVSLLLNAFKEGVSPQASDTTFAKFSGLAQKAIELFQPIAQKLVQEAFQGLKKDPTVSQFTADNRTEVWAAFTSTGSRQPQAAGPRTFWQAQPTAQNYPQASMSHGYQVPTTPMQNGMNAGLPQAAQQMFGNFGNAGMTQAQQAQAQPNPLNPQFAFATQAQNSQTHGSQPYLSPNQSPYAYNEKDPEEFKSEEAHDDERGQGRQQGDQGQQEQQQQHNGYNIVTLMGPDGRLNTLDVNGGISVVKSFFRSATIKKLHILDEIYDNQQMLNPQAGAVNTYLFRAATTQEIYNQMAPLSNGQVIQIMMTDIRNLPTSTTQLSTSKPANDNVQPALVHAA